MKQEVQQFGTWLLKSLWCVGLKICCCTLYNESNQALGILGKLQQLGDLTCDVETSPLFHMTFRIELWQIFVI